MAVGRGTKWVTSLDVAPWYLFHGALGVLGLWMIMKTVG